MTLQADTQNGRCTGCNCDERLLRRLADSFEALNWGWSSESGEDAEQVGSVLGINGEDVEILCRVGLLSAIDEHRYGRRFHAREVLRFMEQHGEWWFALRANKQKQWLHEIVERQNVKPTDQVGH